VWFFSIVSETTGYRITDNSNLDLLALEFHSNWLDSGNSQKGGNDKG
jgi:hypothetical protein